MRGYERGPVDDAIRDLNKDLMHLSAQNAQLAQELKETKASREAVDALLSEVETPSYSGVGAKAALILSTAEDQAQDLIRTAKAEAASLRKKLQDEIQALHGEAKGYYDSLVAEAQRRADRADLREGSARRTVDHHRRCGGVRAGRTGRSRSDRPVGIRADGHRRTADAALPAGGLRFVRGVDELDCRSSR